MNINFGANVPQGANNFRLNQQPAGTIEGSRDMIFTPDYVNQLIQNNGGHINDNVIHHILTLFPNLNLRSIFLNNPWLINILVPNLRGNPPVFPRVIARYLEPHRDVEVPKPRNHSLDVNTNEPSGATGEGLKRHHKNKWIAHVKAYSKKHNIPYHLAIQQAKATYK